ncbi:hypothetical protein BLNAU_21556 [Blattamonas nauphoetae]|uniref:Protein kinase domain-containing protein n=1 Tax=Blattamonas nauphoetae TaxID=2049346 RepID=A0ABQ9WWP0_9EUKA|nr:hypothetical protein BLNAU_21556 [Blattamonas nauphoetae]
MNSGGSLLSLNSSFISCTLDASHQSKPFSIQTTLTNEHSLFTFQSCTFKDCTAATRGGALFTNLETGVTVQIKGCSLDSCSSSGGSGGAVSLASSQTSSASISLESTSFVGCSTVYTGGSVYCYFVKTISIADCVFLDSKANTDGGALYLYNWKATSSVGDAITNCLFQNCRQLRSESFCGGGGMYVAYFPAVTFSSLQFRHCSAESGTGHDIYVLSPTAPAPDASTISKCSSQTDKASNLLYVRDISPNDRSHLLTRSLTEPRIVSLSATPHGDTADLVVRLDKEVTGRLFVLVSNVGGERQPGSTAFPNIGRLVAFDLSSSTGTCSVRIGETGLLQTPLFDYSVIAASASGDFISSDGIKLNAPRALNSVSCTLDESQTSATIVFQGEEFPTGQYEVFLHDGSSLIVDFSTDSEGHLVQSHCLGGIGDGTPWKEGSAWIVTEMKCVSDDSIKVMVEKTIYFTIPVLPSKVTGINSPLLNKKNTEVSFEIVGSGFASSITSVSLKRGERTITSSSITKTTSTSISVSFPVSFAEDDSSCQFGETYELSSIASSKTIAVPSGLIVTIPSPPTVSNIFAVSSTPNEFVLKMEGTDLPLNEVFLAQIESLAPIRVTMSGDGTSGESEIIRPGQSHLIQFDTSYTVKTLRKEGDDDEHILLISPTFKTPLGPSLKAISCPLNPSDANFVVVTVEGERLADGQYFVLLQKGSEPSITVEIQITSNKGAVSVLAFGAGVLEYSGVYTVKRMWSESVEVVVSSGASSLTVAPAPARIESALCVLFVESEKKTAKLTVTGCSLPTNKGISMTMKPLSSDGQIVDSPITFDSLSADTASTIIISVDMYATQPKLVFGTQYEVTSLVIADTVSVLNPKIQFSVPIAPVRVDDASVNELSSTTIEVKICGSGFAATEMYTVGVSGIALDGVSGGPHSQTITVVTSETGFAVSSSIVLGTDDAALLRFGYTYTIKSITNGTEDGFVEGTPTFKTPLGPSLKAISCPLNPSNANFVVVTVEGERLADDLYFVLLQKGSEPSITVEIQITSNKGAVSVLAFGAGVLEYSGVYTVKRMWSESVEVVVSSGASSLTVAPAPARIESALCVLSVESKKKEAKLTVAGCSLPTNKGISMTMKPLSSDGQIVDSPITFDSLSADTASTIIISVDMYATQPKLVFGTQYEVTSLVIADTVSVLNPKIQFSVPIAPVRVDDASVNELSSTTIEVKICGSGFAATEMYTVGVSGIALDGVSGGPHSQTITVVTSETGFAVSSSIVLGTDDAALLRFGYTYTIKSITNGTEDGFVEGTPTFKTPSFSGSEPRVLSASVETNGQKTRMWIVLSGENLLQGSRFTLTLNDSVMIGGVMTSSSEGKSDEEVLGFPESLSFSSKYRVTDVSNSEGDSISAIGIEITTPSKPTELTLFVCSDISGASNENSGTEATSCVRIERAWEIAEVLGISKTTMGIVESAEQSSTLAVSSIAFNLMSWNMIHSELTLFEPPSTTNTESVLLRVNANGECRLTLLAILVDPSSPSFVFISAEHGTVTIQTCSISSTSSTASINEESFMCSWSNGLLRVSNSTTVLSSVTMKNVVQGGIVQMGGDVTISKGEFSRNGPIITSFPSARQNIHCEEEGNLTIDKSSVEDTDSMWIDVGDCTFTGSTSFLASPLFVPSLNSNESKSEVSKSEKSISVTLKGEMLMPCGLCLEVFEWNRVKDEKGKSEIVELSTDKTSKWTETEIVVKLRTETDVKNFSSSLEWRGRLVYGNGVMGSEWMVISGAGSGNKAEGGVGSMWWLPVMIVLACALLIALVIALICCQRRQKTKLLLSNQEQNGQQIEEMTVKYDESPVMQLFPHSTNLSLIDAGTVRPERENINSAGDSAQTATVPSREVWRDIPRGMEREAVRCEEPFKTVVVNGTDTLFNRLHKSGGRSWERMQWKVAAHSLTKGLIHVWKEDAHSDVLIRLNPHNVVLDVDNTPCLVLPRVSNTQAVEQSLSSPKELKAQMEKKNEEGQRWEAPEATRTMESESKNEIDQAKACVFSLGLVMWEMGTQLVPFGEIDGVNAHRQIGSGVTPRMDKLAETGEGELILRCLALNPKERPTLDEVVLGLEELLKKKDEKNVEEKVTGL